MNIVVHVALTVLVSLVSLFIGVFYSEKISPIIGIQHNLECSTTNPQIVSNDTQKETNTQITETNQIELNQNPAYKDQTDTDQQQLTTNADSQLNQANTQSTPAQLNTPSIEPENQGVKVNVNQYDKNGKLIDSSVSTAPVSQKDGTLNVNVNIGQGLHSSHPISNNESQNINTAKATPTSKIQVAPKLNLPPLKNNKN